MPEDEPEVILTVRVPATMRDALREAAEVSQRSMGGQLRWIIQRSLEPADQRDAA